MLYTVVLAMTFSIVGNLRAFGAYTTPVLMVKTGWLSFPIRSSVRGANTGIYLCWILIIRLLNKFCEFFRPDRPQIGLVRHSRWLDLNSLRRRLFSCSQIFISDCCRFLHLLSSLQVY